MKLAKLLNNLYKDVRCKGVFALCEGESIAEVRKEIKDQDVLRRFDNITNLIINFDYKSAAYLVNEGTGDKTVDAFLNVLIKYFLAFGDWELSFFTKIVMKLYDFFVLRSLLKNT